MSRQDFDTLFCKQTLFSVGVLVCVLARIGLTNIEIDKKINCEKKFGIPQFAFVRFLPPSLFDFCLLARGLGVIPKPCVHERGEGGGLSNVHISTYALFS